jgi:Domain of unknown function (DUF1877)
MICNLLRVSKTELDSYLQDSKLLETKLGSIIGESPIHLEIDKAWDGINFLLTGENIETDHELGEVMLPDLVIDEHQDLGYGPAMYLLPERVKELHDQIFNISPAEFKRKYDADVMEELGIYPGNWHDEDEMFEYLAEYFEEVQGFYAEAAKNKEVVIVYLT